MDQEEPSLHASQRRADACSSERRWSGGLVALVRFLAAADFTILRVNLALFVVGGFPRDQLWRIAVGLALIAVHDRAGRRPGLVGDRGQGPEAGLAGSSAEQPRQDRPPLLAARVWSLLRCLSLTQTPGPSSPSLAR